MPQKINSGLVITVVAVFIAVFGGVFWMKEKSKKDVPLPQPKQAVENSIVPKAEVKNPYLNNPSAPEAGHMDTLIMNSDSTMSLDEKIKTMIKLSEKSASGFSEFSYFPDKVIVSGQYMKGVTSKEWSLGPRLGYIYFRVDDINKIPHNTNSNGIINFINTPESEREFGVDTTLVNDNNGHVCRFFGKATIEISNYFEENSGAVNGLSHDSAKLERIISETPYETECYNGQND